MPKKKPTENTKSIRVNSYKLFHRRHSLGIQIATLAELTNIPEKKLEQFETVSGNAADHTSPDSVFPIITPAELTTLAKALNVTVPYLQSGKHDDFMTEMIAYMQAYSGNKPPPQGRTAVPSNW